jgi:hypothetical protein
VAISYELDPCDQQKAQELYEKAKTGEYEKSEFEDIENIVFGIVGQKGAVHVDFGQPLLEDYETPEDDIDGILCNLASNASLSFCEISARFFSAAIKFVECNL